MCIYGEVNGLHGVWITLDPRDLYKNIGAKTLLSSVELLDFLVSLSGIISFRHAHEGVGFVGFSDGSKTKVRKFAPSTPPDFSPPSLSGIIYNHFYCCCSALFFVIPLNLKYPKLCVLSFVRLFVCFSLFFLSIITLILV